MGKPRERKSKLENREKTLYVSDLDGTLLNSRGELSSYTRETLTRLIRRGMQFTYATARSFTSAYAVMKELPVEFPAVVYNGTFVCSSQTGKNLIAQGFTPREQELLFQLFQEHGLSPQTYSLLDGKERVSWQVGRENEAVRHYLESRRGDPRLRPVSDFQQLKDGDVFYFTAMGDFQELEPLYRRREDYPFTTFVFQKEPYAPEYWLEIMPKEATKAQGVQRLKELLGCSRVVAFGDTKNDIPLLQAADEGYAVGNAVPELVKIAHGQIGSNDEDGVARWLEENSGF